MSDKVFADGFIAKRSDKAPDYVLTGLSIKVSEALTFLQQHAKNDWVNLKVMRSKNGKLYVELDTWEPNRADTHQQGMAQAKAAVNGPSVSFDDLDGIPF
jgi:hypothetical protein